MMATRKLLTFDRKMLNNPIRGRAECQCGHTLRQNEKFMAYPEGEDIYRFVCLTCHFWNVHEEAS